MPSRKYKIYNDVMVCDTKWINLSSNHMTWVNMFKLVG